MATTSDLKRQPRHVIESANGHVMQITKENGEPLEVLNYLDVSESGLGIFSADYISPGSNIFLSLDGEKIVMEVRYCLKDLLKKGFYRCGFHTPEKDIGQILVDRGFCTVANT